MHHFKKVKAKGYLSVLEKLRSQRLSCFFIYNNVIWRTWHPHRKKKKKKVIYVCEVLYWLKHPITSNVYTIDNLFWCKRINTILKVYMITIYFIITFVIICYGYKVLYKWYTTWQYGFYSILFTIVKIAIKKSIIVFL